MKRVRKYFYLIALSALLAAGAVFVCIMAERLNPRPPEPTEVDPAFLVIGSEGAAERIAIYDAGDGNRYVFLPSYAQLDRVTVAAGKGHDFTLGGVALVDGLRCDIFRLDTPYVFASDGQNLGNLRFCRSENVAAIYIDTKSGDMKGIHRDTFPEERVSTRVYTADGRLELFDEYVMFKCRGYSSYGPDKKSYTLSLLHSTGLLEMGSSEKWTLTANGFDETGLRNKIAYAIAEDFAPYPGWAPECTHTELYLNGEYVGLYLLCQKPDTGPDHLNLPPEDYYFEMLPAARGRNYPEQFAVCASQTAEIIFPKKLESEQKQYLENHVRAFHRALLSEDGTDGNGRTWQEYIDMDSWARKYLIEEVFSNIDGGRASHFYLLKGSDGKLYAGHCWDYDLSMGDRIGNVWDTTYSLLAQRDWDDDPSWFGLLCRKEAFMDAVKVLYEREFRPLLLRYTRQTIPEFAGKLQGAVGGEYLRWPNQHKELGWEPAVDVVITFLQNRIEFLDALWLEAVPYCRITAGPGNFHVPAGTACGPLLKSGNPEGIWYLAGTDIPFDVTQPVTGDLTLSRTPASEMVPEETQPPVEKPIPGPATQDYVTAASAAALGVLLLCFAAVDRCQRRRDGRGASRRGQTERLQ